MLSLDVLLDVNVPADFLHGLVQTLNLSPDLLKVGLRRQILLFNVHKLHIKVQLLRLLVQLPKTCSNHLLLLRVVTVTIFSLPQLVEKNVLLLVVHLKIYVIHKRILHTMNSTISSLAP